MIPLWVFITSLWYWPLEVLISLHSFARWAHATCYYKRIVLHTNLSSDWSTISDIYRAKTKLWEGNVFTGVCHSVREGVPCDHYPWCIFTWILPYLSLPVYHTWDLPLPQIPDMRPTPSWYWHLVVNIKWWPPKHVQLARGRYASYSNGVLSMFTFKNHFTRTFRNDTFTILVATICYHQIVSDSEKHFLNKVRNFFWGDMVGDVTSSPTCHRSFLLLHVWRCTSKDIFYRAFHSELCVKS